MGIFQVIFAIAFVGVAIFIFAAWVNDQRVKGELRQQGVTAQAVVLDRHHEHNTHTDSKGMVTSSDSYYVSYRFTVDGTEYRNREGVSFGTYEALANGSPVEVVYLPSKPNEVRLASDL